MFDHRYQAYLLGLASHHLGSSCMVGEDNDTIIHQLGLVM